MVSFSVTTVRPVVSVTAEHLLSEQDVMVTTVVNISVLVVNDSEVTVGVGAVRTGVVTAGAVVVGTELVTSTMVVTTVKIPSMVVV